MFILDLSGSMNRDIGSKTRPINLSTQRLTVMKAALDKVLDDPDLKNINIGLMGFSGINSSAASRAHGPVFPVENVEFHSEGSLIQNPDFDPSEQDSAMYLSIESKWSDLEFKYKWLNKKKG